MNDTASISRIRLHRAGRFLALTAGLYLGAACTGGEPEMSSGASSGGEMAGSTGHDMAGMQEMDEETMEGMASSGSIRIDPDRAAFFGITFDTAGVRELTREIRVVGTVEFDETRMASVAPKFSGWVEGLRVDHVGQTVRAGEPLFEAYAPELVTAQEELLLAARLAAEVEEGGVAEARQGARELRASALRRLEYWDISADQIERLLEAGEIRRTLTLHAPIDGVVMSMSAREGRAFRSGEELYMIAGLDEVWVQAELFEADLPFVREGLEVQVTVAGLPGQSFGGRIDYLYPTLRQDTRSLRARIVLPNPNRLLRPGMYATVRVSATLGRTLTVPGPAVLHTGERAVVFVDLGEGELVPREIELGVRGAEFVQVLSGLEAGERVVTSAQFLLDSESNVAEVMRAMMAQMGSADMGAMEMEGMEMDSAGAVPADSTGGN